MKKGFKRKLAAWVGILFVITQIIPARTINATTEEEENKKYGTIEHYNGILFGDDKLVSYDNKNYAYISKGGDNEGAVAVGGDMHTPYLDNSMDFGASAASGYTGIGSKYEDNGMPTVMTSGKWDKIIGSNITVYGSKILLAQEYNQGFAVMGADVNYSGQQNIKNSISKFKGKVSNTIGYIESLEINGSFEDNSYGKNIITNNGKNIVKVKLDSGIIPSLDLKESVDLDKQYVIYSNAKDIKFSGGCVRYNGADVWGSSLPKDSPLFKIASNFIWVFPNAETVEINNYAVIGSVVAPKAKVHGNGSSINGQLFASSLHQEGGFELHNFTSRWNWELDSKGSIEIEKVDSKNSSIKLAGAVFEVYDSEENLKGTIKTNSQGKGSLGNLEYGEYTLVEKIAPLGYVLSSDRITVNVNSEGITYKTITNTKILGKINILKVDSADENIKLPGAVFEVKDSQGTVVDTITTDENGVGTSKELPYGSYTVAEVSAPSGYELSGESKNVTIDSNGQIIELTFKNSKLLGSIAIEKVDSEDSEIKLKGAEFKVLNSDGEEVGNIVTGEDGKGSLGSLAYGEYTVIETKAPDGYELSLDLVVVEVNSKAVVYKTITNTKILGKINILKVDSADENIKLPGAVFEVKDSQGTVVDTITTDENGVGTSKELPYGSYTVAEVSAPSGYELSEESKNVTIDSNGETIELTFENTKILGKINILKVDSIDESIKLSGAEFEIRDLEGNTLDTIITNEEGVANSIQLPYGSYIVIETKAPEGYVLSDFSENVTINNENLEILLKVENIKEELLPEDPKEPEVPSKEDNEKEPVKTGDESGNIGGLGLMSLLSLIAMLLMHKKK
ncbi:MAG: SpaA isopeptide-forming pilin-related protein [Clostridium sp.]|uniref:SpaA isopeptide-forming pilin-related protein n=1 Tax=Clostridium sp. TaxID=1506 RepID=UPI002904808C|nr:SpaA isopeptide-forming pilin-related protein [Clostridium sp.]MDU2105415.1 SpaA isopeptide-forming pilin-related protein [Clostridium sp.]